MKSIPRVVGCMCALASAVVLAQGRGGGEWTTSGYDAQRTAWIRSDARLTKQAVQKGEFQFLWKAKFDNDARQLNSLTEPILLDRLIGFRGFKALAFIGGSDDRVFAIDTDLGRPYWTTVLNYSANTGGQPAPSRDCPGGLIATPTRRTTLAPSAFGVGGFGGARGVRTGSAVGEPGKGAAVLSQMPASRGAAPPPASREGGGRVAAVPFGGVDPVYAMATDGMLHTLASSNGADQEPPVEFLPASARPSSLIWIDGTVYTTTSNECGAAPNAVWAIDLTAKEKQPVVWKTGGASVAGTTGVALGFQGDVYVALGAKASKSASGARSGEAPDADAVVVLDSHTLAVKDWFGAPGADFNTSPIVIHDKDREYIAVAGNDGKLYLLDGKSVGGSDHKTPLYVTPKYTAAGAGGALATWENDGTRWILAPSVGATLAAAKFTANGPAPDGAIVAFKLVDQGGKTALEPAWASRDLTSPLGPVVVNGLVIAASSGEYRPTSGHPTASQRAQRSLPAVLYVLDGLTGKELWSSGKTITSFARGGL
ncbi:MAG TPA: hypothetical protein VH458_01510, partial [Vicinamibacterales bacterium]